MTGYSHAFGSATMRKRSSTMSNGQIQIEPSGSAGHFYVAEGVATVLTCIVRKTPARVKDVSWFFTRGGRSGGGVKVSQSG